MINRFYKFNKSTKQKNKQKPIGVFNKNATADSKNRQKWHTRESRSSKGFQAV